MDFSEPAKHRFGIWWRSDGAQWFAMEPAREALASLTMMVVVSVCIGLKETEAECEVQLHRQKLRREQQTIFSCLPGTCFSRTAARKAGHSQRLALAWVYPFVFSSSWGKWRKP